MTLSLYNSYNHDIRVLTGECSLFSLLAFRCDVATPGERCRRRCSGHVKTPVAQSLLALIVQKCYQELARTNFRTHFVM